MVYGARGPLHSIDIQGPFHAQVDAESSSNARLLWLVGAPTAIFAIVFTILEGMFGGAAMLLIGTAALFFSFGREDYPTITQRFLARARAGDNEGAALVVESAGVMPADDEGDFADVASVFFSKLALQRWFGSVIYFTQASGRCCLSFGAFDAGNLNSDRRVSDARYRVVAFQTDGFELFGFW